MGGVKGVTAGRRFLSGRVADARGIHVSVLRLPRVNYSKHGVKQGVFSRHRYFAIITDPLNHSVCDVITDGRAITDIKHRFEGHKDKLINVGRQPWT